MEVQNQDGVAVHTEDSWAVSRLKGFACAREWPEITRKAMRSGCQVLDFSDTCQEATQPSGN